MLRVGSLVLCASMLVASAAQAQVCEPGKALIVLDRSGSMKQKKVGTETRWDVAKRVVGKMTANSPVGFGDKAEFGLMMFPKNVLTADLPPVGRDGCTTGSTYVETGMDVAGEISTKMNENPPDMIGSQSNSFTPLGQTMEAVSKLPEHAPGTPGRKFVILLSDGKQDCLSDDTGHTSAEWTAIGEDAVGDLYDAEVKTFVVGFATGGELDVHALNQMAYRGGTARAGCNPDGTVISGTGKECFYFATSEAELLAALNIIGTQISEEVCDGKDNDCDNLTDEGLDPLPCGNTFCPGTSVCMGAAGYSECDAREPVAEDCSTPGDDDCDGAANEGCGCDPNGPGVPCGTETGECTPGVMRCLPNGSYDDTCVGEIGPSEEICDGKDNDCDGQVDEAELRPGDDYPQDPCVGGGTLTPPPAEGGNASGCACEVGGGQASPGAGLGGMFLLLGLAAVVIRRRR